MLRRVFQLLLFPGFLASLPLLTGATGAAAQEVLFEWKPGKAAIVEGKLTALAGPEGSLAKPPAFDTDGLLIFDGQQAVTFPSAEARNIPLQNFSVEARVRVDQLHPWGCIVAYSQDNGAHERGWILGYNGNRFHFKLSNGGALAGAISPKGFTPGEWAHLAGLFDGQTVRLYVNGRLAASADLAGDVVLPKEETPFVLGAYKDDDEYFPITGRIASVKISKGLVPASAFAKLAEEQKGVAFAVQPRVAFPDPSTAVISWQTDQDREAVLFYGSGETLEHKVVCQGKEGQFAATLPELRPATTYSYRIGVGEAKERRYSKILSLDTRHNLSPAPVKPLPGTTPDLVEYADRALALAPDQSGYALVLGLQNGRLPAVLAARSRFHVIAADTDPARVAQIRKTLYDAKLLGHRVTVVQLSEAGPTPWTDSFADLVLSERDEPAVPVSECRRLARPNGGLILLPATDATAKWRGSSSGWKEEGPFIAARRGKLEGAQDWSHQYGTPGNATYTGEALGEVSATSGLGLQWIGLPGGDFGIDRQPRMPAPLSANGRLYHQGMNRLVALNAFNGAVLWSYEIPALRRLNIPHDCSNWSADDDHLFVAIRDRLWMLGARRGELKHALQLPKQQRGTHEWGFVANEGQVLIGSAVRADSSFQEFWGDAAWFDKVGAAGATTQVCSERLFAYRTPDAEGLWAYGRGLVINSTIALHHGKLYFLENRNLKLPEGATGRVTDRRLWIDLTAVCLDAKTGQVLWDKPAPKLQHLTATVGFVQSAYGIATDAGFLAVLSEGTVDAQGAYQKRGEFRCSLYDGDGGVKWETTSPWSEDHHGKHITHPVVTENRLYFAPHIHDLANGQPLGKTYGPRRGCSTIVATRNALMFRILGEGSSPLGFWNTETGSVSRFMRLRPSCWLNSLPAQGMLLVPEGGAGCSCGGWMETSVGFLPRPVNSNPQSP